MRVRLPELISRTPHPRRAQCADFDEVVRAARVKPRITSDFHMFGDENAITDTSGVHERVLSDICMVPNFDGTQTAHHYAGRYRDVLSRVGEQATVDKSANPRQGGPGIHPTSPSVIASRWRCERVEMAGVLCFMESPPIGEAVRKFVKSLRPGAGATAEKVRGRRARQPSDVRGLSRETVGETITGGRGPWPANLTGHNKSQAKMPAEIDNFPDLCGPR